MAHAALITGGARRIGRAIALGLAEDGYDIALHYSTSNAAAQQTAEEIRAGGRQCRLFPCDFRNMDDLGLLMPAVFSAFPECRLLVNNASIFEPGRLSDLDGDFFDHMISVNLKTPLLLSKEFALRGAKGHIINILDTRIRGTLSSHFVYVLTKKALYAATRMAAKDLAPNVRVNGICPGLILPPRGRNESYLEEKAKDIPLQKAGNPEDIVKAVLFLEKSGFVTGECLFVDGGEQLRED